jgi:hypothetical protein
MEAAITTSLDPIGTLNIRGLGRHKHWLIGAWLEFESPSTNFSDLVVLGLEEFGSTIWGAFVLVIVCKPTPGSNAVSPCHQLQYWED